jgi:tetratricopeptide (TPR) repeat protein
LSSKDSLPRPAPPQPGDTAEALTNLGRALLARNKPLEALAAHDRALAINPNLAEAHGNRGNTLKALHRTDEAIAAYRQARELWPDSADLKYNEALVHLLKGDLLLGWEDYECRWDREKSAGRRPLTQPVWKGKSSLQGKSILVHAEQGLGDTLQFVRYLPLLTALGAEVHLEVQPTLQALLLEQSLAKTVSAKGDALPKTEWQCPLLSLPGAFATNLDSIPARRGYLKAPAKKVAEWHQKFAAVPGPKIGLVWSGNPSHQHDRQRSIPLAAFQRIFRGQPGNFFGLQREVRPGDAPALAALPEVMDLGPRLRDFAETAAIVASLDLVITVDTAVAHLAGAMGIKTWLLLAFAPDWRWLLERKDSPWYASIRLFRQPAAGSWGPVLEEVRMELGNLLRPAKVI